MVKKLIFRILHIVVVLLGVTFLSFTLLHLAPGNPAEKYLAGTDGNYGIVSQEAIREQERKWGLDKPFFVQYFVWLGNACKGDLGNSYSTGHPVVSELFSKVGPTVLLYVFGLCLRWINITDPSGFVGILLPMAVLAFQCTAKFTRQVRAVVLEQMNQEYVRGLSRVGCQNPVSCFPTSCAMPVCLLLHGSVCILASCSAVRPLWKRSFRGQASASWLWSRLAGRITR